MTMEQLYEPDEQAGDEGAFGLSREAMREVQAALEQHDADTVYAITAAMHTADLAYLLDMLPSDDRRALLDVLGEDFDPHLLTQLEGDVAEDVIDHIGADATADALSSLETDEAVGVLEEIEPEEQQVILDAVSDDVRDKLEEGLAYPEDSVGRIMRKKMVLVPEYWAVGDAIDFLRTSDQLPDEFYSLFVVDARNRPVGYVQISRLIRAQRDEHIRDMLQEELRTIPVTMDQEEAALLFRKYGMVSAPVVSEEGRMQGMITIDDIANVIEEEADEDLLRMGGVNESDVYSALTDTVRQRFPWLLVNLATAILASIVIGQFEEVINTMVALAVLMPIIASMGGNAGTQTVTVAVRAIATRELTDVNAARVIGKELLVGFINGLMFAVVTITLVMLWYQDLGLALVFGAATVVTLTIAGLSGALIPLALTKFGSDPAISSSVFLTTVTDVVGFFTFLGFAALILL